MQFGVNMKIYTDQCTLAGGHAARVCDGYALRRPSLRNVFRLGGGATCSSQRRPRPGTHFRSPSVLSCELCECRGVRTDTISLDSPAGFVDACCQAVVSTLCSAPASAALGLDALTHVLRTSSISCSKSRACCRRMCSRSADKGNARRGPIKGETRPV